MGAFNNAGLICDMIESLSGQAGVHKNKINRRFLWDLLTLKGMDLARRSGLLEGVSTFETIADQDLYEKPAGVLYVKDIQVEDVPASKTTRADIIRLRDAATGAVSSQTTTTRWLYWMENRGTNGYIGLADDWGTAPQSAGDEIRIYYSTFPDRIEHDDDQIGIPEKYMLAFCKAMAAEVMRSNGQLNNLSQLYDLEGEKLVYDAVHDSVNNAASPIVQYPLGLTYE